MPDRTRVRGAPVLPYCGPTEEPDVRVVEAHELDVARGGPDTSCITTSSDPGGDLYYLERLLHRDVVVLRVGDDHKSRKGSRIRNRGWTLPSWASRLALGRVWLVKLEGDLGIAGVGRERQLERRAAVGVEVHEGAGPTPVMFPDAGRNVER